MGWHNVPPLRSRDLEVIQTSPLDQWWSPSSWSPPITTRSRDYRVFCRTECTLQTGPGSAHFGRKNELHQKWFSDPNSTSLYQLTCTNACFLGKLHISIDFGREGLSANIAWCGKYTVVTWPSCYGWWSTSVMEAYHWFKGEVWVTSQSGNLRVGHMPPPLETILPGTRGNRIFGPKSDKENLAYIIPYTYITIIDFIEIQHRKL